ncbi:FAD/NAD(P)-binding protein [Rhizobium leguminosarum]|uniref:FAD-dependent urate hydroxylase HpyO/Asp monooxygenase CreE-like FAD/NAD(P)-binding domain-containing protein n=1 Tax=Rhizobium leguminosarum TaxID=384 RepID=A0A7K3VNY0_RHILE|nr:FAD/NAD(P)-binding protein [Rhizobium leguminosarum]NEK18437.1 hypothetical protein [Rhizobium leguminosarum]NEK38699.1 hypothetical protein [Rhizobium leguminosarum]
MNTIAIIGSGPTGIYTLRGLLQSKTPLDITMFEAEQIAGKGMPYHPALNDAAMLSNIASIELPAVRETLVAWLTRQDEEALARLGVPRDGIDDRTFYPRVVLGDYFQDQLRQLLEMSVGAGHRVQVRAGHRVTDLRLQPEDIQLTVSEPDSRRQVYGFDHVVMATGHTWPDNIETKPGYFISPWPTEALETIGDCSVGVVGTSLSGIDAVVGLATKHGSFYLDANGILEYHPAQGSDAFHLTMMSRKGLLPEADFFCPIPYVPLTICTDEAVDELIESGRPDLLDAVFALFKEQLAASDPDYAAGIGLSLLDLEGLSSSYFKERQGSEPFVWAARNLAEAKNNRARGYTVPWRYAILRMHENIARVVPALDGDDLERFHKHFKTIFVDNYATVPHESIERLLALRRAGKLDVLVLGDHYEIETAGLERGARVLRGNDVLTFGAFVDATGQSTLDATDIPFPTLVRQGVVRRATTREATAILKSGEVEETTATGGIDLDDAFRLVFEQPLSKNLYCVALSFLLHKHPFVQGITSAHELGGIVSDAIIGTVKANGREPLTDPSPE